VAKGPIDDGSADNDAQGEKDDNASGKPLGVVDGGGEGVFAIRLDTVCRRCGGKRPGANGARRGHIGEVNFGNEGVALAGNGFDEGRLVGRIAEDLAQLVNGGVDVGVKVDVDVGGPQAFAKRFAGDNFAGFLDQDEKNFVNFSRQFDASAPAIQRLPAKIIDKRRETNITLSK